jgi:hypothetical protein
MQLLMSKDQNLASLFLYCISTRHRREVNMGDRYCVVWPSTRSDILTHIYSSCFSKNDCVTANLMFVFVTAFSFQSKVCNFNVMTPLLQAK